MRRVSYLRLVQTNEPEMAKSSVLKAEPQIIGAAALLRPYVIFSALSEQGRPAESGMQETSADPIWDY